MSRGSRDVGEDFAEGGQRIDLWLWHARVVRTRPAAASLALSGHVRVNGARIKSASREVRIGDVVTVALDRSVRVLRVCGFSRMRGNAETASELYTVVDGDDLGRHATSSGSVE